MKNPNLLLGAVLAAMVTTAQGQAWITNGLVAYYPFNGNADDASGSGNNGMVSGASFTLDRFGVASKAIRVPTGATMNAPLANYVLTHTNTSTISVWIKLISFNGAYGNVAGFGGGLCGDFGTSLQLNNTKYFKAVAGVDCATYPNFVQTVHPQPAETNRWYHLLSTFNNGSLILYLDGVRVGLTNVLPQVSYSRLPNSLFIGAASASTINAIVDDVRIYNRALSSAEVAQLYEFESGPRVALIKAVKPSFSNLTVGTDYQMEISSDMNTWTNYGSPFTATNLSMIYPQYWDVEDWGRLYFRLKAQ